MPYIICNENDYLLQPAKGEIKLVNNMKKASKWEDELKANNFFKSISKSTKFKECNLKVEYVSQEEIATDLPVKPVELSYDILEKVKEMHVFTKELENRKLYLSDKLSKIDLEIVDIEHAAEFYNLNASQGYKLYKLLHDRRIERRKIKDELQIIGFTLGTTINSTNIHNLERSILGMDNKKYTPRINKELFGV